MSEHALIDRLQRASQRGESVRKMANRERITVDTVRRIISTPRFQRDLTMRLVKKSLTRSRPSPRIDRIIDGALTRLLRLMKSGTIVPLSIQDIVRLGEFSNQQRALAMRRG